MQSLNLYLGIFLSIFWLSCNSQVNNAEVMYLDRQAKYSGSFYPGSAPELEAMLKSFFKDAAPKIKGPDVLAIVAPHAGYIYSGQVAASAYNQIDAEKKYKNIFIVAPSHHVAFDGASVYNIGNYITPLGRVKVNRALANQLISENPKFTFLKTAHSMEHSLEVQLPFLQYQLKHNFQIVPIVLGCRGQSTFKEIAKVLKPWFTSESLFVFSSDFSHYPVYEVAKTADQRTADAICSKSIAKLKDALDKNTSTGDPEMHTSMCGAAGIFVLEYLMQGMPNAEVKQIQYRNSGDVSGDKSRVVGYWALSVVQDEIAKQDSFTLNEKEKQTLLNMARATLENYLETGEMLDVGPDTLQKKLLEPCGAFVTLNKHHNLRGCIGRFYTRDPLYSVVQEMAVSAAIHDSRFPNVKCKELDAIEIEISVLTPLRRIYGLDEIELGKHGIYVKKGRLSGTYLPQVAVQTNWTTEEFVGNCAVRKAGLPYEIWNDNEAELYVYEAIVFGEGE